MAFLSFVCMFTQLKSVYIVTKLIVQIQLPVTIIGALASLIRLMLRDNAIADSGNFINRLSMQV